MTDKFALNRVVRKMVDEYCEKHDKNYLDIIGKVGLSQPYFSHLMNYNGKSPRIMSEEVAIQILLVCDYRLSEAHRIISEVKVADAIKNLPESDKKTVINKVIGNDNTVYQITGNADIN